MPKNVLYTYACHTSVGKKLGDRKNKKEEKRNKEKHASTRILTNQQKYRNEEIQRKSRTSCPKKDTSQNYPNHKSRKERPEEVRQSVERTGIGQHRQRGPHGVSQSIPNMRFNDFS